MTRGRFPGGRKKALSGAKNRIGIYPGQYYDQETGLHYNYHRYYDPRTGRYLRADPIGFGGGINLYVYTGNNPMTLTDSQGLYGADIHREATEYMALWARYSYCAAAEVADADQGVDEDPNTSPWTSIEARRLWHFPSEQRVDDLFNIANSTCDLAALGRALHALQDSYSHAGYGPRFGHVWDSITGRDPDDPSRDLDKTQRMLKATYDALVKFLKKCPKEAQKCCLQ